MASLWTVRVMCDTWVGFGKQGVMAWVLYGTMGTKETWDSIWNASCTVPKLAAMEKVRRTRKTCNSSDAYVTVIF
jgi:hypothetical protein